MSLQERISSLKTLLDQKIEKDKESLEYISGLELSDRWKNVLLDLQMKKVEMEVQNVTSMMDFSTLHTNFAVNLNEFWQKGLMENAEKSVLTTNASFFGIEGSGGLNFKNIDFQKDLIETKGLDITRIFYLSTELLTNKAFIQLDETIKRQLEAGIDVRTKSLNLNKDNTSNEFQNLSSVSRYLNKNYNFDIDEVNPLDVMVIDDEIAYVTAKEAKNKGLQSSLLFDKSAVEYIKSQIKKLHADKPDGFMGWKLERAQYINKNL